MLIFADENSTTEAVRSDRRDSRGLRRANVETGRKETPPAEKCKSGEKLSFVGEKYFISVADVAPGNILCDSDSNSDND